MFNNSKHKFTSTHDLLSSAEMKANISTKRVRLYYICLISKAFGSIKITEQSCNAIQISQGEARIALKSFLNTAYLHRIIVKAVCPIKQKLK